MRLVQWLLFTLLLLLGLGVAVLTLGAFAGQSAAAPLWLRSVGSLESVLVGPLSTLLGTLGLSGFMRAVALSVLASLLLGAAAFLKPRF